MVTGPQQMPVFSDEVMRPEDKRAIIAYLNDLHEQPNQGGLALGGLGPVSEGLWAWITRARHPDVLCHLDCRQGSEGEMSDRTHDAAPTLDGRGVARAGHTVDDDPRYPVPDPGSSRSTCPG